MVTLSEAESRERFGAARVARLATADGAGVPHLVPFTFAVAGDLVFHAVDHKPKRSADLKRIRNIRANARVSALADHYGEDWSALWWVRVDGVAEVWEDDAARDAPLRLLAEKYPQYADRPPAGPVIAIRVVRWTGWSGAG